MELKRKAPPDRAASQGGIAAQTDAGPAPPGPMPQPGKRAVDLLGGLLILALSWPLLLVLAVLVKASSRGPVLHRRRVLGPRGEFDALKFRTMRADADVWLSAHPELLHQFQQNYKLRDDPRVTPVGKWLRRASLDELPQLFNVMRGEMSLVGPRMISPEELTRFGNQGWIFRRVRPGLTGYWQLYARQQVSYSERVSMETEYVQHWSLLADVKLLLATPWRVVLGRGAY